MSGWRIGLKFGLKWIGIFTWNCRKIITIKVVSCKKASLQKKCQVGKIVFKVGKFFCQGELLTYSSCCFSFPVEKIFVSVLDQDLMRAPKETLIQVSGIPKIFRLCRFCRLDLLEKMFLKVMTSKYFDVFSKTRI